MRRAWAWGLALTVVLGACDREEGATPEDGLIPSPPSLQAAEADLQVVTLTEEQVARLVPGQYFGELGSLLGYPRSASARAATDVELTAYGPQSFRETVLTS